MSGPASALPDATGGALNSVAPSASSANGVLLDAGTNAAASSRRPSRAPTSHSAYGSSASLRRQDSAASTKSHGGAAAGGGGGGGGGGGSLKRAGTASLKSFGSLRLTEDQAQEMAVQRAAMGLQISDVELENIRRIFTMFDDDGSNSIDLAELANVMESLGVRMDTHSLRELVEQVTEEGESELSFDQFVSLITLWKEAAQYKLFDDAGFESLARQHIDRALESQTIVPDSGARAAWDMVVCLVAVLYWIFCLLLDVYDYDATFDWRGLVAGDVICTVLLVADIVISSQTAFMRDGRTIDAKDDVWDNYRKSWLLPDVLAALPLDLILTAAGATVAATVLRHLRLVKLLKLPYLWRSSDVTPITSGYITFHFHLLPIFQLLVSFCIMVHGFAIGWILLKQMMCEAVTEADRSLVRYNRTVVDAATGNATNVTVCEYPYTPAVYFIIYSLSTVGLGDVVVSGEAEYWYACFVLVGAMLSNGIVIGKLVQILQRADIKKEQRSKIRETLAVLEHYHIASQLQTEILQFQAHVFENNLGAAYESIISGLPAEMRTNISLFVRMKLVSVVPLFQESHFMLRIAVAQVLTNAVARPEQYICVAGQQLNGLFFLAYGFADTFDATGNYAATLRSGDFFGENSLVGSGHVRESVKALTFCDLWILQGDTFDTLLSRFPKFARAVNLLRQVQAGGAQSPMSRKTSGTGLGLGIAATAAASVVADAHAQQQPQQQGDSGNGQNTPPPAAAAAVDGSSGGQKSRNGGAGLEASGRGKKDSRRRRHSAVTFEGSGSGVQAPDDHRHMLVGASAELLQSIGFSDSGSDHDEAEEQQQPPPTMSVAEIHDFVEQIRAFRERLNAQKNA